MDAVSWRLVPTFDAGCVPPPTPVMPLALALTTNLSNTGAGACAGGVVVCPRALGVDRIQTRNESPTRRFQTFLIVSPLFDFYTYLNSYNDKYKLVMCGEAWRVGAPFAHR